LVNCCRLWLILRVSGAISTTDRVLVGHAVSSLRYIGLSRRRNWGLPRCRGD
jgi:hypothetical protein